MISVWETHGRSQENFEQVSDCSSRKNIWDPAERLVLGQKHRIIKNIHYIHRNWHKIIEIWQKLVIFIFWWFQCERHMEDLKKTLNKSQIVCREKIFEIPQSDSCLDRNIKLSKTFNICLELTQNTQIFDKTSDFHILMISVWETHGRSQENFEQVSDCLSKKFFCDPAEQVLLGPKHQKLKKRSNMCIRLAKYTEYETKTTIFLVCIFLLWELPWWSQEIF